MLNSNVDRKEAPRKKIFCIGFQKTGTSTLQDALIILGYRACGTRYDLIEPIRQGNFAPVHEVVSQFDVFGDNPWPVVFKQLDAAYPGSRFILTVRDEASWIRSCVNHFGILPDRLQKLVYGVGAPSGFEDVFLARYRRHNREVFEHFASRPNDILILDFAEGDGWAEICGFLGHEVPPEPLPFANARTYDGWASRFNFAITRVVRLLRRLVGRPADPAMVPEPIVVPSAFARGRRR